MNQLYVQVIQLVTILVAATVSLVVHEMGHALAALLFTTGRVGVNVGFYGNPHRYLKARIGRLDIRLGFNPFMWLRGYYSSDVKGVSLGRHILIILAGPLMAFLVGAVAYYSASVLSLDAALENLLRIFFYAGAIGLVTNLIPRKRPLYQSGEMTIHNDGFRVCALLRRKDYYSECVGGLNLYDSKQYSEAAIVFDTILRQGIEDRDVWRYAISSHLLAKDYRKAYDLSRVFEERYTPDSHDHTTSGLIKSSLGHDKEALADYDRALFANPHHSFTLNARGYSLSVLERYAEAIEDLDKAIEIDPDMAYAYNNRGLAKIKFGMADDGLRDVQRSLELDEGNSYAYRNLGIYHFERGELQSALELFERARELDADTDMVDDYIERAREGIASVEPASGQFPSSI